MGMKGIGEGVREETEDGERFWVEVWEAGDTNP